MRVKFVFESIIPNTCNCEGFKLGQKSPEGMLEIEHRNYLIYER